MTTTDDSTAEVVRDLAFEATKPQQLELGGYYTLRTPNGVSKIDLTGDDFADFPKRKQSTVTVRDIPSFACYWDKHHDGDSEVFGDLNAGTVTAVLDAHRSATAYACGEGDAARWQQHRLILQLQQTEPWKEWTGFDGQLLSQPDFAEFVEDHARYVYAPDKESVSGADLLEIAQHFKAHTKVDFTSGHLVSNGQTEFAFTEDIQATAKTNRGTIKVPNQFAIAVKPYDDCDPTVIVARFRYRLDAGKLLLGYKLDDAKGVARQAVADIVVKLSEECNLTVMHGRPA
jgi:uncharacterized protein YfdQ (DUF2303 family)